MRLPMGPATPSWLGGSRYQVCIHLLCRYYYVDRSEPIGVGLLPLLPHPDNVDSTGYEHSLFQARIPFTFQSRSKTTVFDGISPAINGGFDGILSAKERRS